MRARVVNRDREARESKAVMRWLEESMARKQAKREARDRLRRENLACLRDTLR